VLPLALAGGFHPSLQVCGGFAQAAVPRFSYSTRGTSMWMSIRSSSGPNRRFWQRVMVEEEQVHGLAESP